MKTSHNPELVEISKLTKKAKAKMLAAERKKLQERFTGAIKFLKDTDITLANSEDAQFAHQVQKQKLFNLPWFLMIGAEQVGKTSLLQHSGLKFLLEKKAKKTNNKTKPYSHYCEWWGTREAVILDVPGNYIFHDKNEPKAKLYWLDFLEQLNQQRHPAINGLIIVLSVESFVTQSKAEQQFIYQNIKKRLADLQSYLKTQFPVYLVISKCDILAGFNEFFSPLNLQERQQTWGVSFSQSQILNRQHIADTFDIEFDALLKRLNDRLITRLHQERTQEKRALVKDFPLQIESLKRPLVTFLQYVSGLLTIKQKSNLRGLYFTSADPQERCVDRLLVPLSKAFNLEVASYQSPQQPTDTSFFTHRLFRDILFKDAKYFDERAKTQLHANRWVQYLSIAAGIVLVIICGTKWIQHFTQHVYQVSSIEQAITQYTVLTKSADTSQPEQFIQALNTLKNASSKITPSTSWLDTLGLIESNKLPALAQATYYHAIEGILFSALQKDLAQQTTYAKPLNPTSLYQTLKAYLMLSDKTHFDANYINNWFMQYWSVLKAKNPQQFTQLQNHIKTWLENRTTEIKTNPSIIHAARIILSQLPITQLALVILKDNDGDANSSYTVTLPTTEIKNNHHFALTQKTVTIPAIFTAKNFLKTYDESIPQAVNVALTGDWVLGKRNNAAQALMNQQQWIYDTRDNYFNAYIETWQKILASLQLPKFSSFQQAIALIDNLVKSNSPFSQLLIVIHDNTNVTYKNIQTPISIRFQKLNKYFVEQQHQSPALQRTLLQLQDYLSTIANENPVEQAAFSAAKQRFLDPNPFDVFAALQQQATQVAPPLNLWLQDIAENSWQLVLEQAKTHINNVWELNVLPNYQSQIQERYPITPKTEQEILPSHFQQFFAPQGVLDRFFNQYLAPFIETNVDIWQLKKINNQTLPLSAEALVQFQKSAQIKLGFFDEKRNLAIPFTLTTEALEPIIKSMEIHLDNQEAIYTQKDQESNAFVWPGDAINHSATVTFISIEGKQVTRTHNGPWAWFRVLDESTLQTSNHLQTVKLNIDIDGYSAQTEVHSQTAINPFSPYLLRGFYCPVVL